MRKFLKKYYKYYKNENRISLLTNETSWGITTFILVLFAVGALAYESNYSIIKALSIPILLGFSFHFFYIYYKLEKFYGENYQSIFCKFSKAIKDNSFYIQSLKRGDRPYNFFYNIALDLGDEFLLISSKNEKKDHLFVNKKSTETYKSDHFENIHKDIVLQLLQYPHFYTHLKNKPKEKKI